MRDFLSAGLRRWYVLASCIALTALLLGVVQSRPAVYSSQVLVAILAPSSVDRSALQKPDAVALASIAVIEMNQAPHRLPSSTTDTTLYGRGTTRGTTVRLDFSGNQWKPEVRRPYVVIEATDGTPEAVQSRIDDSIAELESTIRRLEDEQHVADKERVDVVPLQDAAIIQVPKSPSRALMGSGLAGLALLLWAVPRVDRRLSARARRRGGTSTKWGTWLHRAADTSRTP